MTDEEKISKGRAYNAWGWLGILFPLIGFICAGVARQSVREVVDREGFHHRIREVRNSAMAIIIVSAISGGLWGLYWANKAQTTQTLQNTSSTQSQTDSQSTVYPASYEQNFMNSCEANSSSSATSCQCILDDIESNYTYAQAVQLDTEANAGQIPAQVQTYAQECAASN